MLRLQSIRGLIIAPSIITNMKSLIVFWNKDIINKLIIVTSVALILGIVVFVWLFISMPQGKSLQDAFVDALPQTATPTFDVNAYLPTRTLVGTESHLLALPSLTSPPPTATSGLPTFTPDFGALTLEPTEISSQDLSAQNECISSSSVETGRVVEIIDGNTIKVLMSEKVYVIRYIGVKVPRDDEVKEPFGPAATNLNSQLVYGKEISLIADVSDKDDRGRLLRYIMVGEIFVNLEILRQGYGLAEEVQPNISCAKGFSNAEQEARMSLIGQWFVTPTP